jgi:membrane fusion protein, copper/silver efflux system
MTTMQPMKTVLLAVLVVAGGSVLGAALWHLKSGGITPAATRQVMYYQDSMHPWIKSDRPGKCTVCGMDLTAIYEGQSGFGAAENMVGLSANNVTVLNVQTEEVRRQPLVRTLQVAGTLEANETRKTIVAAPAAGRIDDLTVKYPGIEVHEGEHLVTFYSPELTLEKRRFLVRARMSVQRDPTGGLAQPQSDSDPYYSDLISPQTGTVVERRVYKGQYVADGERLFTIVDLSVLWFRFDVYEQQLPWLTLGQTIDVTIPAVPGRTFRAVVAFIEPMLNEATRTVKVRAELENPVIGLNGRKQRLLGLGMYAQGEVRAEMQPALAVPRTAVLQPGGSAYAYVDKGNGVYEKRRVKLGHQGDWLWEAAQGLEAGERVVTAGNVLIDAQAQFTQSGDKPEPAGEEVPDKTAVSGLTPAPDLRGTVAAGAGMEPKREEMKAGTTAGAEKPPARPRQAPQPVSSGPTHGSQTAKLASDPRHPHHPPVSTANPGFRNTRLGPADAAFDAAFNRMAELRNSELAERTSARAAPPPALTASQARDVQAILNAADKLCQGLAADDLNQFKLHLGALVEALDPAAADFPASHQLSPIIQQVKQAAAVTPVKDLAQARSQLLALGAATAELARELGKQDSTFAGLKVYHCPMAPKPGLWVQADGPLRNPFFGAKMLNCGEEVPLTSVPAGASLAKNNHDQLAH